MDMSSCLRYVASMEHWGGNIQVNEANQEALCWGKSFMDEKMAQAKEDCEYVLASSRFLTMILKLICIFFYQA